ncbi:hypothetical protein IV03_02930 [Pseudomonas congelans]|nr:hypothetical protein IV03_02930 [Pseudomonas congelans]
MLAARTCVEYPEHAVLDTLKPLVKREPVTQSVTKGIPTLEREERQVFGRNHRAHAPRGHAVLDALRPPLSSSTWRESVEYVYNNQRTCVNRSQTIHRITA